MLALPLGIRWALTPLIDAPGSDQNGKHLLGSSPAPGREDQDAHKNALYEMEEEAMRIDCLAEELGSENKDEMEDETKVEESESCEYKTAHKGIGIGVTTRPTPVGLILGLWAGGGEVMTKKCMINDEETMLEEKKRLELEVRHCEMVLTRAKVESMRNEINKLSLEKTNLSGFHVPGLT